MTTIVRMTSSLLRTGRMAAVSVSMPGRSWSSGRKEREVGPRPVTWRAASRSIMLPALDLVVAVANAVDLYF